MRVLVVTNLYPPEFLGGYELGCAQMVGALRTAGHDVHVVTSVSAHTGPGESGIDRVLELPPIYSTSRMELASHDLQQHYHQLSCTVNPANVRAIGETVAEFNPDVAYLWNLLGIGGLGVLALLDHWGLPWVWHLMDSIPRQLCSFGSTGSELARELGRIYPGRYVACSSHLVGEIRDGGVALSEHVDIIPNWVHGDPPPLRTDFYAGGTLRLLSASGTLCEPKGTHILIESAALARQRGFGNFTIDIYGHEEDPRFRAMIHRYGVEDLVRLMGPRSHDKLLELYDSYDVFAFPTWSREPFGFAPLEAAAAGCVPLFTDDCGIAEWLIDGVDCIKAPRTAAGFAERYVQILEHQVDIAGIGRRGQAVAWREFHISSAASRVQRILGEAMLRRRAPRGNTQDFYLLSKFAAGLIDALVQEAEL